MYHSLRRDGTELAVVIEKRKVVKDVDSDILHKCKNFEHYSIILLREVDSGNELCEIMVAKRVLRLYI